MDLTIETGTLLLNLDQNQQRFQNTVTELSSGLRVNSAADDPSGNAIATSLQSKSLGLQQAAQNVQNANNALNVAMGALNSVQTILERMNTLIVESNSDINSASDLQNIQNEINQLMTEINTIGEKTNFNGLNLLNGQFDTSEGTNPTLQEVNSPFGTGSTNVSNYNGLGQSGPLLTGSALPPFGFPAIPGLVVLTVTGYSPNAVDPDSGTPVGPGDYVELDVYSSDTADQGAPLYQDISAVPINSGQIQVEFTNAAGNKAYLVATLSNLTQNDVGSSIAYLVTTGTNPAGGSQLTVNDGGEEGTTVGISLPTVSTGALGLDSVSVLAPDTEGIEPGSLDVAYNEGANASNNMSASYSEVLVGNALTAITSAQAQIGAQVVSLNVDNTDDNTASNEYTQSASDITDLNVGQAATQFTQEQILVNVGTSVLSQVQSSDKVNTALLIQALVA
jgi:flagellin